MDTTQYDSKGRGVVQTATPHYISEDATTTMLEPQNRVLDRHYTAMLNDSSSANLLTGKSAVRTHPLHLDFSCQGLGNLTLSQSSCFLQVASNKQEWQARVFRFFCSKTYMGMGALGPGHGFRWLLICSPSLTIDLQTFRHHSRRHLQCAVPTHYQHLDSSLITHHDRQTEYLLSASPLSITPYCEEKNKDGRGRDLVLPYYNHSEVPTPPNVHSDNLDRN
ncbi:hypothetical protein CSKR_103525 [Clonorchis sinensis]|uniref:Uncharacterized protein n=1 Tax=Clonorchis sinensis TaxID=79923 RepID=A0A419PIN5_CLOSI|nr:hypothetical protein CSKR_103525 [Clonorchis sinensis]